MSLFARPSSAVQIVRPDGTSGQDDSKPPRKDSVQRQCRNVMIYGSCKFQDKGCLFQHPSDADESLVQPDAATVVASAPLTAQAVNAPVFVPKSATVVPTAVDSVPPPDSVSDADYQQPDVSYEYGYPSEDPGVESLGMQMQDASLYDDQQDGHYASHYDQAVMDTFYSGTQQSFAQPLDYHLYTAPIPPNFAPSSTDIHFMPSSSSIRETLQARSHAIGISNAAGLGLPEDVSGYHTLTPLETVSKASDRRKFGNWFSTVYRAINSNDGHAYCLRRVENFRVTQSVAFAPIEAWTKLRHPNIVSIKEAFTSRAFGDNSLFVAYAYHANAKTLADAHFKSKPNGFNANGHYHFQHGYQGRGGHHSHATQAISERTIWSYITQIASALKRAHGAGLAIRTIELTKILVVGKNRLRIGSCGIFDVLSYDIHQDLAILLHDDFVMFGRLIVALCCNNPSAALQPDKYLDVVGRSYGADLKNLASFLLHGAGPPALKLQQLCDSISGRLFAEVDDAHDAVDRLEGELMSELENARLFRLICKFGFINERPEFARELRWSDTGDRYIIKLFRDYVFHQVDENGNPVVNLSHVLTCLNKLDAGAEEKIMLVARDEQSCLVVSYKDIKACMESAFNELARSGTNGAKDGYR
ncbi:hypothetical protein HGRIS_006650 [Hohenbuehelia grisea]|uniref:PAN2-PAN3 deadenylation complex subunit PAN3 n=1 Tax=Hohenbuehelia grisea TaxID=104357 RepID=A0ABR3JA97_9AGAR